MQEGWCACEQEARRRQTTAPRALEERTQERGRSGSNAQFALDTVHLIGMDTDVAAVHKILPS